MNGPFIRYTCIRILAVHDFVLPHCRSLTNRWTDGLTDFDRKTLRMHAQSHGKSTAIIGLLAVWITLNDRSEVVSLEDDDVAVRLSPDAGRYRNVVQQVDLQVIRYVTSLSFFLNKRSPIIGLPRSRVS